MTNEEHSSRLHAEIMNLQGKAEAQYWETYLRTAYSLGHRDARHAAAELAQEAIAAALDEREREAGQWRRFAAYCRSCALSGESNPHTFEQFVSYTAALSPEVKHGE